MGKFSAVHGIKYQFYGLKHSVEVSVTITILFSGPVTNHFPPMHVASYLPNSKRTCLKVVSAYRGLVIGLAFTAHIVCNIVSYTTLSWL